MDPTSIFGACALEYAIITDDVVDRLVSFQAIKNAKVVDWFPKNMFDCLEAAESVRQPFSL